MRSMLHRAIAILAMLVPANLARAAELGGSPSSMAHQHAVAVKEEYTFLRTPLAIRRLADQGRLVEVRDGADYVLSKVSYPYTRPEVRSFVEHFAKRYREATGHRLVVTSLTRPAAQQPRNAHKLSVHPAGMAVDLRVPADSADRAFIERALLAMEREGMLDVTRERQPPHYHIAVFAEEFAPFAARLDSIAAVEKATAATKQRALAASSRATSPPPTPPEQRTPLSPLLFGLAALAGLTAPAARRIRRARRVRATASETI